MTGDYTETEVKCYSGYRGDERPRNFQWEGRELEVAYIIERWTEPAYRYFKVCGSDALVYLLRHDTRSGAWELSKNE